MTERDERTKRCVKGENNEELIICSSLYLHHEELKSERNALLTLGAGCVCLEVCLLLPLETNFSGFRVPACLRVMTGGVSRYTHVARHSAKADMGEDETMSRGQIAVLIAVFVKL